MARGVALSTLSFKVLCRQLDRDESLLHAWCKCFNCSTLCRTCSTATSEAYSSTLCHHAMRGQVSSIATDLDVWASDNEDGSDLAFCSVIGTAASSNTTCHRPCQQVVTLAVGCAMLLVPEPCTVCEPSHPGRLPQSCITGEDGCLVACRVKTQ